MEQRIFFSPPPHKIYVEAFGNESKKICLFIHGGYHSGVCWNQTPDGRLGWARLATQHGYWALTTDMPGVGRSGTVDFKDIDSRFVIDCYRKLIAGLDGEITLFVHSLSGFIGFKLAELLPGKIKALVAIEPSLIANVQEQLIPTTETDTLVEINYRTLPFKLDMTKPAIATDVLIQRFTTQNNPQKILFPKDEKSVAQYVASLQPQHPKLMYELFNINGSKPPIEDFSRLQNTRMLVITTPDDPVHKDDDVKIVNKLREEGCKVEFWEKGFMGTGGNSHMLIVEQNNNEIFDKITTWLEQ